MSLVWSIIKTLYWSSRGGPGDTNPPSSATVPGSLREENSASNEITTVGTVVSAAGGETEQRSARSGGGVLGVSTTTNGDISGTGGTGDGGGEPFATEEEPEIDETTEIFQNGVHFGLPSFSSMQFFFVSNHCVSYVFHTSHLFNFCFFIYF